MASATATSSLIVPLFFAVFSLILVIPTTSHENNENSLVKEYDQESFDRELQKKAHFVVFYAPWCGHCKRLMPTLDELAEEYNADLDKTKIIIAKVDCTEERGLCQANEVRGYPTLKLFKNNAENGIRYSGQRDVNSIVNFIESNVKDEEPVDVEQEEKEDADVGEDEPVGIITLTKENFKENIIQGYNFIMFHAPWCGHCKRLTPTWFDLGKKFLDNDMVGIAMVDCVANEKICQLYKVSGYPTLLMFYEGEKVDEYNGARDLVKLENFVKSHIQKGDDEYDEESQHAERVPNRDSDTPEMLNNMKPVVSLSPENFDEVIAQGFTFVKFFTPWCGFCKKLAPVYEQLGEKMAKIPNIVIGEVDCTEFGESLCKTYQVRGYPTLILFKDGDIKDNYMGPRDVENLFNYLMARLPKEEL